jgi:hypothetical protein
MVGRGLKIMSTGDEGVGMPLYLLLVPSRPRQARQTMSKAAISSAAADGGPPSPAHSVEQAVKVEARLRAEVTPGSRDGDLDCAAGLVA